MFRSNNKTTKGSIATAFLALPCRFICIEEYKCIIILAKTTNRCFEAKKITKGSIATASLAHPSSITCTDEYKHTKIMAKTSALIIKKQSNLRFSWFYSRIWLSASSLSSGFY